MLGIRVSPGLPRGSPAAPKAGDPGKPRSWLAKIVASLACGQPRSWLATTIAGQDHRRPRSSPATIIAGHDHRRPRSSPATIIAGHDHRGRYATQVLAPRRHA